MLKEIRPDIFLIGSKSSFSAMRPPVNIYVLAGEIPLVFDSGFGLKSDILYVKRNLEKIASIYSSRYASEGKKFGTPWILPSHSHADHFSGAAGLKKITASKIMLTEKMKKAVSSKRAYRDNHFDYETIAGKGILFRLFNRLLDVIYEKYVGMRFIGSADMIIDEESLIKVGNLEWRIIPLPGHSSDHIGLYCESEGVLFSGDNVLRSVITWLGPPDSDLAEYEKTLKKMLALPNLNVIFPAHGSPVTKPHSRIMEIISHRKKRLENVFSIIRKAGKKGASISDIQDRLYPGKGFLVRFNSEGWIRLVVNELIGKERIKAIIKGKKIAYIDSGLL